MKKNILLLVLFVLCAFTFGCYHTSESFDVLSNTEFEVETDDIDLPDTQEDKKEDPEIENDDKKDFFFEDQDLENIPVIELNTKTDYVQTVSTYTELMKRLEIQNGILVSGKAYGLRKKYYHESKDPFTETFFEVEQIYYGSISEGNIKIIEPYTLINQNDSVHIEYAGPHYSMLKDDQTVLMFLLPYREGVYYPIYYELPLPEDYQTFDEAAKKELLDYYRGKDDLYKVTTTPFEVTDVLLSNGAIETQYSGGADLRWPRRDISDEALLEEMSDHILVRLAFEYDIKIWPENHIRFASTQDRLSKKGIQELSLPDDSVAKS